MRWKQSTCFRKSHAPFVYHIRTHHDECSPPAHTFSIILFSFCWLSTWNHPSFPPTFPSTLGCQCCSIKSILCIPCRTIFLLLLDIVSSNIWLLFRPWSCKWRQLTASCNNSTPVNSQSSSEKMDQFRITWLCGWNLGGSWQNVFFASLPKSSLCLMFYYYFSTSSVLRVSKTVLLLWIFCMRVTNLCR